MDNDSETVEAIIGEIRMFAGNFAPPGWHLCDGQLLSIVTYGELYKLIGTTYGGNGRSNFALPDLRSRVPVHINPSDGYTLGQNGGAETVTLQQAELPTHNHTMQATTTPGSAATPGSNALAQAPSGVQLYREANPQAKLANQTISGAGSGASHPNIQPYITVNFIIALEGSPPTTT